MDGGRSVGDGPGDTPDPLTDGGSRPGALDDTPAPGYGAVSLRYHRCMAMTLRLTEDEQAALRQRAEREGISMQDAARRAVRDYISKGEHRERVAAAAERVKIAHAEALERLGD